MNVTGSIDAKGRRAGQPPAVMLVTGRKDVSAALIASLEPRYEVRVATGVVPALASLYEDVDVVMTELTLMDGSGLELVRKLEAAGSLACGVIVASYADYAAMAWTTQGTERHATLFLPADERRILEVAAYASETARRRRLVREDTLRARSHARAVTSCR